MENSIPSLLEAYASQQLSRASDFTGEEERTEAGRVYLKAVKGRGLRSVLNSSGAPPVFPSIQTFQKHVVSNLCNLHKYSVYRMARHMPYTI